MKYTEMEYLGTAANCFKEIKKIYFPKSSIFRPKNLDFFGRKQCDQKKNCQMSMKVAQT